MNNNIPEGYDENGVRGGNGNWVDTSDDGDGREQGVFDDYDYLKEIDKGHFVECAKCSKLIPITKAIKTYYGTGYLCEKCMKEFDI